ncbi:MAG: DUF1097 domain-containing protein [Kiritimatiellaeota bacterium]|nr:DUF1097 domain-containing protein [Kiritimatiellota bacterium]
MALKNSQLMVVSCGLALQAFILVLLNAFIPKAAGADAMWIAFQAWAVYFLSGCNPMGGVKAWIGYATGIAASIAIIELMGVPGLKDIQPVGGMNIVMAIAVFIVVIPAIMSENLKNMVPALFIGSGAFFGLSEIIAKTPEYVTDCKWTNYGLATRAELVYCAVGLLFGFITVFWRGKYEATLSK